MCQKKIAENLLFLIKSVFSSIEKLTAPPGAAIVALTVPNMGRAFTVPGAVFFQQNPRANFFCQGLWVEIFLP